ncbi:MAG TPA: glycosyl hydrolase family 8, partial [Solirubrobacteraceae bacterium]|nr:glycosyl hydrolase family 8 [Solirubrobacteraceae bacterium]
AVALAAITAGPQSRDEKALAAADGFLDRYVERDGRVVRRDQGGDTVSEGQAYAMLLAAATRDERRFARVWRWTRTHLQRRDGLLAWRWAGGRLADREPATDADLDAARALLVAARRFDRRSYRAAGLRIGRAVLASTTSKRAQRLVLTAGPWARDAGVVNPSYFSPRAYRALGGASRDGRWGALAESSRRLADRLTEQDPHLAPDWARVEAWGVQATGAPGSADGARHGYDAVRVPVRLAESCSRADRAIAARAWPTLRTDPGRAVRPLDGSPAPDGEHPAALAGAAGAAGAAGDAASRDDLLDKAGDLDEDHPTYYGAAWHALARVMLTTRRLGGC